jgi:hypothetical protein
MELFLNLCWLSLLPPAYLLWRRRTASTGWGVPAGSPAAHPLVFLCALGCVFVLLFPVISISDDLHAMRPEMEESERAFRHAGHRACTLHALTHSSQPVLPSSASLTPAVEQIGTVLPFMPQTLRTFSAPAPAGRAPPSNPPTSL